MNVLPPAVVSVPHARLFGLFCVRHALSAGAQDILRLEHRPHTQARAASKYITGPAHMVRAQVCYACGTPIFPNHEITQLQNINQPVRTQARLLTPDSIIAWESDTQGDGQSLKTEFSCKTDKNIFPFFRPPLPSHICLPLHHQHQQQQHYSPLFPDDPPYPFLLSPAVLPTNVLRETQVDESGDTLLS